ncbi:hypothetical protein CWR43_30115 [Rhizobium sullae]|uniref:DUF3047 domain-containing protein n=1 Tax=Rhizobium sullae TaxID=50338 RepID=A0A2N0D1F3_RHISU|nr:DUF3047 domain-containing protein [Rhizobium sullae]PKA39929.1 hypothetical protein CWR43_30115 [Rhizobium sullae]
MSLFQMFARHCRVFGSHCASDGFEKQCGFPDADSHITTKESSGQWLKRPDVLAQALKGLGVALSLFVVSPAMPQSANGDIHVGRFSQGSLSSWSSRSFNGETKYEFVKDPDLGSTVLAATADAGASGRYRKIKIDLTKTPFMNWSWKVTQIFPDVDENVKSGDDFPARIYVVIERGLLGTRSLALNYVWASRHRVGSEWPSPYTTQVLLMATDSGTQGLGSWVRHKRNLREDLKGAFREDITEIDAVAIMTDADDHKGRAQTYYGDIWFSAE